MNAPAKETVGRVWDAVLPSRWEKSPIELNSAAKSLGARDILYRAQLQGYTHWLDAGPRILIALTRSDGRRRATLAHECGHLLVDPLAGTEPFQEMSKAQQERWTQGISDLLGPRTKGELTAMVDRYGVERTCDLLSYELLFPSLVAQSIRKEWGEDLQGLRSIATDYRLSLTMTMIRLNEIRRTHALLSLHRTPAGRWIAVRTTGVPRHIEGRVECAFEDQRNFIGERRLEIFLQTRLTRQRVPASVVCTGSSRLALIKRKDLESGFGDQPCEGGQLTFRSGG